MYFLRISCVFTCDLVALNNFFLFFTCFVSEIRKKLIWHVLMLWYLYVDAFTVVLREKNQTSRYIFHWIILCEISWRARSVDSGYWTDVRYIILKLGVSWNGCRITFLITVSNLDCFKHSYYSTQVAGIVKFLLKMLCIL